MATSSVRGVSRVLEKLEASVKNGNFYEAHQMYRTLYFRYLAQKKYKETLDMLYTGALLFLEHDQQISGADLAILLVDVLHKSGERDFDAWTPKLAKLFASISAATPERDGFLAQAVQWTAKGHAAGHPFLHQCIAQVYWDEQNFVQARHHFIYSQDGRGCAKLLIEFQVAQGFEFEADLFIAQAVLQYLCLSNTIAAYDTFINYTKHHPNIQKSGPPYLLPLLNFLFFLLQAVETRKLQTFAVLRKQYEVTIRRDPCYGGYLDKIGQIFFGVKPPQQRSGGLFGSFFENFFRGLDDSEEEAQAGTSSKPQLLHSELD